MERNQLCYCLRLSLRTYKWIVRLPSWNDPQLEYLRGCSSMPPGTALAQQQLPKCHVHTWLCVEWHLLHSVCAQLPAKYLLEWSIMCGIEYSVPDWVFLEWLLLLADLN